MGFRILRVIPVRPGSVGWDLDDIRGFHVIKNGVTVVAGIVLEQVRQPVVVVDGVHHKPASALFHICGTGDCLRLFPCRVQRRQKHAGEDCDDRNYHEELYKGELLSFS